LAQDGEVEQPGMLPDEVIARRCFDPKSGPGLAGTGPAIQRNVVASEELFEGLPAALDAVPILLAEIFHHVGRAHACRRDDTGEVRADMQPFHVAAEAARDQQSGLHDRVQQFALLDRDENALHGPSPLLVP
jgi:hypothetical protein